MAGTSQQQQASGQQIEARSPADPLDGRPDLQDALKGLLRQRATEDKMVRRTEVIEASQQRFYDKGYQHIWFNEGAGLFALASGSSSVAITNDDASTNMPHYLEDYNIYGPYGRISSSVLTQNPPGVNFEPDDPSESTDIDAAKAAELYRHAIDRANDRKALQAQIACRFWTDGRTIAYTHATKNKGKYGKQTVPKIEIYGVLESKVPTTCRTLDDYPYLILTDDIDVDMAKEEFPDLADKIHAGPSSLESAYERYARLGAMQGTSRRLQPGDAYQHLVSRHRCWVRPAAFRGCADETGDELRELFPKGCHAVFVGDVYCFARQESMDDHIAVAHPKPGDGQNRPSLGKDCVALQDAVNDYKNQEKEYFDYGIGSTWVNSEVIDQEAVREQISQPGNRYSATMGGRVQSMSQHFFVEPPASCPPGLVQAYQDMRGAFAQFILGAPPALFGASDPHNETAVGMGLLRDQAMGQQGLPWSALQQLFATIYRQAVKCVAQADSEDKMVIAIPGRKSSLATVAIADMANGNFHCTPDTDSNFPETWASKRGTFMQLFDASGKNPALGEIINQPDNLEMARELLGLPELVIPGAEARNKQVGEIEKLLATQPIPPDPRAVQQYQMMMQQAQQAAQMGQPPQGPPPPPPQPQPSVPIDPVFDLNQYEFAKCQEWLNSQARRDEEAKGNQAGIENVKLHAMAHKQAMQQDQGPPPKKPESDTLTLNYKDIQDPGERAQALAKFSIQAAAQPQPQPQPQPPAQ